MDANAVRQQVEAAIAKGQEEILAASRKLAEGLSTEAGKVVPPMGEDLTNIVEELFDFVQGVVDGQRLMVSEVLQALGDALNEASANVASAGRTAADTVKDAADSVASTAKATAKKVADRAPAKKAPAKKAPAKKAPAAKKTAKKATKKATKKTTATKKAAKK